MIKLISFIGIFLATQLVVSAQTLTGKVLHATTKQPIARASVFISNSSKGTITNDDGAFIFTNFPTGTYDVVVSCIGFATKATSINIASVQQPLTITIEPASKMLDEVIVRNYEKNGWEKWGKFFTEQFIGTTAAAKFCTIKNKEAIGFVFNKKKNVLEAYADETLIVENKYLGYEIMYTLSGFEFNFTTRIFYYQGYPLFKELEAKKSRVDRRYENNRDEVYQGSIMHFMRSFYRNKLLENGFEVRKLVKVENQEKKLAKEKLKQNMLNGQLSIDANNNSNSNVLSQPDMLSFLDKNILPSDSFGFAIDSTTALLEFEHYLQVTYLQKRPPIEYNQGNLFTVRQGVRESIASNAAPVAAERSFGVVSSIHFPNKIGVSVYANGSYYSGKNMITDGYWAFSEKLSNLLPLDFRPIKK